MDIRIPNLGEGAESGSVVSILVKEGDSVAKDQTLIELDDDQVWTRKLWSLSLPQVASSKQAYHERLPVPAGRLLRAEVEGTCDAPSAKPWVNLHWVRGTQVLGDVGKTESCTAAGTFRIVLQAAPPRGTEVTDLRLGAHPGPGVRVTKAGLVMQDGS